MTTETLAFQTEVKQLQFNDRFLVFQQGNLRELISNSSDALDKLRFAAIAQPTLLEGRGEKGRHYS